MQQVEPLYTSRQRMQIAMSGQCPDRIPTMPQICYPHAVHILCEDYRLGIKEVTEKPQRAYELILEIAQRYAVDGLRLFVTPEPYRVVEHQEELIALDRQTGTRVGRVDLFGGGAVILDEPEIWIENAQDLKKIPRPQCFDILQTRSLLELKETVILAHKLDFFVASSPPAFTMNYLSRVRGRERALMDLMTNPDLVKQILEVALSQAIEHARALVHCGVDALYIGDPSASASLISPKHFEEFCLPFYQAFCSELHREDILIYLHICGNSTPILEMMADTGADCIEPLDPLGGVKVSNAKERIGNRVALMGGVNTITLLEGRAEDVYEEAIACCRSGGQGGGYILAAGDMVPDFTPEVNVQALIRAAREFTY